MSIGFKIVEPEAKIILESLIGHEERMARICRTSDDEDLVADIGNDLIEVRLLLKRLKEEFGSEFGPSVFEFSTGASPPGPAMLGAGVRGIEGR